MFCRFCGKEIPEGGRFCPGCGKEADTAAEFQAQTTAERMPAAVPVDPAKNYRMAWFKFIIYFQLFANAVVMVFNAASGIFGLAYGDDAGLIYGFCPMLKAVDVIYGIICLAFAVTAVLIPPETGTLQKKCSCAVSWICWHSNGVRTDLYTFFCPGWQLSGAVSASVMDAGASGIVGNVLGTVIGSSCIFPA